jgi:peptide/nickel transport system substrate-binding protein
MGQFVSWEIAQKANN